jgi:hypothetical protein
MRCLLVEKRSEVEGRCGTNRPKLKVSRGRGDCILDGKRVEMEVRI